MSSESTQIILQQFLQGQVPPGTILSKVVSELSPADIEKLRTRAAEGMMNIELEKMAAVGRFHASSADIKEFIENVRAIEINTRGPLTGYTADGEFNTASGKTRIQVNKGCFIATAVYGGEDHHNVMILRKFRDEHLESSRIGTFFCSGYYWFAPKFLSIPFITPLIANPTRRLLDSLCKILDDKS
jgi:hypothetical protein